MAVGWRHIEFSVSFWPGSCFFKSALYLIHFFYNEVAPAARECNFVGGIVPLPAMPAGSVPRAQELVQWHIYL